MIINLNNIFQVDHVQSEVDALQLAVNGSHRIKYSFSKAFYVSVHINGHEAIVLWFRMIPAGWGVGNLLVSNTRRMINGNPYYIHLEYDLISAIHHHHDNLS